MTQNKKIGLALGGGAVLGAAHVGVIKALREKNIKISYVAGTSIGAIVAAFFAFNKTSDEMQKIASQLRWMDISGMNPSRFALLSNKKLGDLIDDNIGKADIDQANIPINIVTTDITNGEKVVLKKGSLSNAVMASACIPGVFTPVEIDNKLLVDGGIVENVPIRTVKEMGADYVIGVDLNAKHAYRKPKNIINVLMNSFHFTLRTAAKIQTKEADLLIKPDLSAFNMTSTKQIDDLIKQGYADAINTLNSWDM